MIKLREEDLQGMKTVVELGIYRENERIGTARAKFIGPIKSFKK
jgi:hypothetical protein